MIKIFDNSAISSMGKEVSSVDLLQLVKSQYDIFITDAVVTECTNSNDEKLIEKIKDFPTAIKKDERFLQIMDLIKTINYSLGPGETETIAASILLTHSGIENYVVIDEELARKKVSKIHTNPKLIKIMGSAIQPVKCTGTIGIVKHLRDKNVISKETGQKIAFDLELSNFRVTDELLALIR
jgi:predicted nucleic acid-binding protein